MELYTIWFFFLAVAVSLLAYWLNQQKAFQQPETANNTETETDAENEKTHSRNARLPNGKDAQDFRNIYFGVYTLVLAADWLQGPYFYSLYRYAHGLPESTVALLFITGFVAAAASASFVGSLADRYGRRNACFAYCAIYSASCASVLAYGRLEILVLGRALGGLSSTLLYSVFEAWMVAEHNARNLGSVVPLSSMFSWSTTLSGVVAIASGVFGEALVSLTGSQTSPFMMAIVCLGAAGVGMHNFWNENYGQAATNTHREDEEARAPLLSQLEPNIDLRKLSILTLVTTVFEGSMYLFVFLWTPTLEAAREAATKITPTLQWNLPLGLIFSAFMCAMMLGSMLVSVLNLRYRSHGAVALLIDTLAIAASALFIPVLASNETYIFWSFAVFEACVGMYYPSIGKMKSSMIHDGVRAKVYAWMRLPLNAFVVVALMLNKDGNENRRTIFQVAGALLLGTAFVARRYLS
ncbi:Molybdate-anion transporter [Fulvia fulva]|uniref:Molybdate-anion transporter n=1 Tax=Passalora fulva TaxID=5499 RepID=A0A9Q8UWC9_PASFU|nr:Molybdate-anion transporter [Fulvia fulva]KAK4609205.1 Molybdate-anion transporter [Fulvia fulva]KAK4609499.1 Molybdate-anion transporter [Fulvia fulva]UJO24865.1 Molybdate-anion transporter [Fulvia fulva]WPV22432.1 Molybdate-anion transporter [Fulvia fulva]WPV37654.1 Molybdate-anion transporter [Fulvia fulva]